ncbi:MAG TPA: YciI family protein [Longimicrobiales bacterium]
MRFIIMGRATKDSEAGVIPPAEAYTAMQKYHEDLINAGILLAAEGLSPSSKGARVHFSGDKRIVVDGPFTESKELVAGFTIIEVSSLQEAIEWVKRAPNVSSDGETVIEIRKLMDIDDFGETFTPNEGIAQVKY